MNTFTVAIFTCMVVLASAKPSGIWGGAGHLGLGLGLGVGHVGVAHAVPAGPITLVGASGVVTPNGAAGPTGAVNGHGAVGPNGIPNAIHGGGIIAAGPIGLGVGGLGLGGLGLGHGAALIAGHGAWDDGQWHGEGLLESQDLAGHGHGHW